MGLKIEPSIAFHRTESQMPTLRQVRDISVSSITSLAEQSGSFFPLFDISRSFFSIFGDFFSKLFRNFSRTIEERGERYVRDQLAEAKNRKGSQWKAATLVQIDDQTIACHYDTMTKQTIADFRAKVIEKMKEGFKSSSVSQDGKITVRTIFLEEAGASDYAFRSTCDTSQVGRGKIQHTSGGGTFSNFSPKQLARFLALNCKGPFHDELATFLIP